MDGPNESPADRTRESEANPLPERLQRVERRLKTARARSPRLDMAALEAMLASGRGVPGTDTTSSTRGGRALGRYRRLVIAAGNWTCGALVGSLVTLLLVPGVGRDGGPVGPSAQFDRCQPAGAGGQVAASDVARAENRQSPPPTASPRAATMPSADAAVLAMLADPLGNGRLGPEGPTLRAGMHHASGLQAGRPHPKTAAPSPPRSEDIPQRAGAIGEPQAGSVSHPEMTRDQLLEELARELPGLVL